MPIWRESKTRSGQTVVRKKWIFSQILRRQSLVTLGSSPMPNLPHPCRFGMGLDPCVTRDWQRKICKNIQILGSFQCKISKTFPDFLLGMRRQICADVTDLASPVAHYFLVSGVWSPTLPNAKSALLQILRRISFFSPDAIKFHTRINTFLSRII